MNKSKKEQTVKKGSWVKTILLSLCLLIAVAGVSGYFVYEEFQKRSPENLVRQGMEQLKQKEYELALEHFKEAEAMNQFHKEKGSRFVLEDGVEFDSEIYRAMALTYYEMQDYEQAISYMNQSLSMGGKATAASYHLIGSAAMHMEAYEQAMSAFDTGIALPETETYVDEKGKEQQADYTKAIQEMKWNRIICFEKKYDWEAAKAAMSEYIKEYPEDADAQKEAEFLSTR